ETSGLTKGKQKQGCCQDPENHHNSRKETKGQTQKTGEGGRGGHLAGILGGGAVTHACRLPLTGGAASFWDWTALLRSHRPPPLPRPTNTTASGRHPHLPPVPSPPHYTAHQPLQGSHGLSGEQFSPGLSSQLPPPTHAYTHALLDKANIPLSRTLHLLRPHSLGGGDIALWAFGLGALSLLLHCSLWLPVVGPGRVPLALKGAQAPSHPGPPYSTALAAAGVASGGGAGPRIPPAKLSLSSRGAHTFHPSPPSLVPALGWAAPFGSRKAGGVCPYSRFTVATAPLPSAWDLSTCGGDGDAVAYCPGEAHEPCGRHLRWAGAAPLTLLCFRHSAISPSSDGAPITRSSPCPLPTPLLLLPAPQGSGSIFPLFTNYLWTVVLFFVQCSILRHPSLLLLPAPNVHPHCLLFCPRSPPPRYSLWGRGAGAWQAG
uniref:Uncharacterized protein n=1 Tax=Papio anubis TaxID=9555 RepID=A0A8I5N492_PAPAN